MSKMIVFFIIGLLTRMFVAAEGAQLPTFNERLSMMMEPDKTFADLVRTVGYDSEEHSVITEDGYILILHRLPGGPTSPARPGKPPVIFFSGIGANSDTWVLQGPRVDLAFMMVDEGYDVWYLNSRGTYYSKHHLRMSPNDEEFWHFSFNEMGIYDAPAAVDYVLNHTQKTHLSVIGHSMGTSIGFIFLSEKPEYNKKVNVFMTFAPITRMTQTLHNLWYIGVKTGPIIYNTIRALRMYEVLPRSNLRITMYNLFCERLRLQMFCQKLIYEGLAIVSGKYDLLDPIGFSLLQHYFPEGIADNVLYHYRQIILAGKFQKYDYGTEENYRLYNSSKPPEYRVKEISTHVILFSGIADYVSSLQDAKWIHSQLQNSTLKIINRREFHHLDFISSKIAKDLLYYDVIIRLNNHNPDHEQFKGSSRK